VFSVRLVLNNQKFEKLIMVDEDGESLNTIFQTLADWESQLKPLARPSASEDSPTPRLPALTKGGQ
jgi:hypothetical protein